MDKLRLPFTCVSGALASRIRGWRVVQASNHLGQETQLRLNVTNVCGVRVGTGKDMHDTPLEIWKFLMSLVFFPFLSRLSLWILSRFSWRGEEFGGGLGVSLRRWVPRSREKR